jgi:hypothetical protein
MRLGLGLGPVWVSGRVPTGRAPRRWLARRSNGWWGWIAVLWAIGSLMSMCSGHPHGTQPTQVTPPLAPVTTTTTPSCAPAYQGTEYCQDGPRAICNRSRNAAPAWCYPTTTPTQPDWKKYCREHPEDWVECGETGPNPVPQWPGGPIPPTPTTTPTTAPSTAMAPCGSDPAHPLLNEACGDCQYWQDRYGHGIDACFDTPTTTKPDEFPPDVMCDALKRHQVPAPGCPPTSEPTIPGVPGSRQGQAV